MKKVLFALMGVLVLSAWMLTGCSSSSDPDEETPPDLAFVGSETCADCHAGTRELADVYTPWQESGHPYKVIKVEGEAPVDAYPSHAEFPNDFMLDVPGDYTWDDISYVIGGYGWKMRWIAKDGYIVTGIENNQYNFETDSYSNYHFDDPDKSKPYDCGRCHTTGWVADEDWDTDNDTSDNQDGMMAMAGTFFAGGVHCEECHGMGSQHVYSRDYEMTVDSSPELCGRCHMRNTDHSIAASSGFIKHHEQYDEWLHSPHAGGGNAPDCNACHDPHASVIFDGYAAGQGVKPEADCESCHVYGDNADIASTNHAVETCTVCHMPKASKSAIKHHEYEGDVTTHIWRINSDPVGKTDGMFNAEGNLVLEDGEGIAAVTLDFACYSCHISPDGLGPLDGATELTLQQLSDKANGVGYTPIHTYNP